MKLIVQNHNFGLLWLSQVVSQMGNRMFQLAIMWWMLGTLGANGGKAMAIFLIAGVLPSILLVKWIGKTIDQGSSKIILLICDSLGILIAVLLALSFYLESVNLLYVYFAGLIFSLLQSFIGPTLNRAVPELVAPKDTENAVAFISSTEIIANFAGAVLGALLIESIGIMWVIILNGLSYAISAVCDSIIKFNNINSTCAKTEDEDLAGVEPITGLKMLDELPLVKKILFGFGAINFFSTPTFIVIPLYVKNILAKDANALGILEASIWLGLLLGTFSSKLLGLKNQTIRLASICLLMLGIGLGLPSLVHSFEFYSISLFIAGFFLGVMNVRMISLFHVIIPNSKKGSFFALLQSVISICMPVGYFTFGFLADTVGADTLALIQGIGILTFATYFLLIAKHHDDTIGNPTFKSEIKGPVTNEI